MVVRNFFLIFFANKKGWPHVIIFFISCSFRLNNRHYRRTGHIIWESFYLYFVYLIKLWKTFTKTDNDKLNRLRKQTYCFIIFVMIVTIYWSPSLYFCDHISKIEVIRYLFMSDCMRWNWGTLRLVTLHFVPNVEKMSNHSRLINMLHLDKKCTYLKCNV